MNSPQPFDHPRRLLALVAIASGAALTVSGAVAQVSAAPVRPLMKKYIGNADTDALFKEPASKP